AGIAAGAFGFSVVLLSPLAEALVAAVGLPRAFRVLGAAFLAITLTASRLISDPPSGGEAGKDFPPGHPGQASMRPAEVLRSPIFWCVFLCLFLEVAAWIVLLPVIKTMALARGMSTELAIAAVMVTGMANALGRVVSAWVSDRLGRTAVILVLCLITCVASLWMTAASGASYIAAAFLIAFAYGGPSGVFPPLVREIFGPRHAGTNFGLLLTALGGSSLVFAGVSGSLSAEGAATGDYSTSFYLTAALGAAAAGFILAADRLILGKGAGRSPAFHVTGKTPPDRGLGLPASVNRATLQTPDAHGNPDAQRNPPFDAGRRGARGRDMR
ncbi:MAG TPA: MFS transporter, partial [Magnetospirillaceae bacterium]|nr:MFS transporter [Magnetospirillaceae bacterium]